MSLDIPTHIPPIGPQTDPTKVNVAVVVGGQLASAPARGIGLTAEELTLIETGISDGGTIQPATAQSRNRIVNGAMQISQENGNTAGTTNVYHAADQWPMIVASTGQMQAIRLQIPTPNGSANRLRMYVQVVDTSIASTDLWTLTQLIEGSRTADFQWGTAAAKQVILRFGFSGPTGTYSVSIRNSAGNRSYIALFTITAGQANTETTQVFIIPGDTTGTWLTDTGIGVNFAICLCSGSTYQGVTGWQSGNFLATSAVSNGMGTVANTFYIYDVGLYMDPLNTGVPPRWTMPDEAEELRACQRYWQKTFDYGTAPAHGVQAGAIMASSGVFSSSTASGLTWKFPVQMRIAPTVTIYNPATAGTAGRIGDYYGAATSQVASTLASRDGLVINSTSAASFTPAVHAVVTARM